MTAPVVSCVIPVFNGERYLGAALESVLGQTHGAVEVIVADDGSTDGTRDVAGAFGPRVRYLHQANAGHAAARNLGSPLPRARSSPSSTRTISGTRTSSRARWSASRSGPSSGSR